MKTLIIELTEDHRNAHCINSGAPECTAEIHCVYDLDDRYLLVRGMVGLNDSDVQAILEGCDHPIAAKLLDLADGCLVDMRATCCGPSERLYAD